MTDSRPAFYLQVIRVVTVSLNLVQDAIHVDVSIPKSPRLYSFCILLLVTASRVHCALHLTIAKFWSVILCS